MSLDLWCICDEGLWGKAFVFKQTDNVFGTLANNYNKSLKEDKKK